jgi:hypothetical protein
MRNLQLDLPTAQTAKPKRPKAPSKGAFFLANLSAQQNSF